MSDFENAIEDWEAHEDWRYADRDAERKFFYLAGQASVEQRVNEQAMQLAVYGSELATMQAKCAELERERDELKSKLLSMWSERTTASDALKVPVAWLYDDTVYADLTLEGEEVRNNAVPLFTHPTTERQNGEEK